VQLSRVFKVGVPVEKHAARFYTRVMFERFQRELYKAGSFTAQPGLVDEYVLTFILEEGMVDYGYPICTVWRSPDGSSFSCDCKFFEHSGMPCRHIIKV
jgi:hypothetical protein